VPQSDENVPARTRVPFGSRRVSSTVPDRFADCQSVGSTLGLSLNDDAATGLCTTTAS